MTCQLGMGTQMSITIGSMAVIVGVGDRLMTTDGDGRRVIGRTNGARVDVPVTGGGGRGVGVFDVDKDVNS